MGNAENVFPSIFERWRKQKLIFQQLSSFAFRQKSLLDEFSRIFLLSTHFFLPLCLCFLFLESFLSLASSASSFDIVDWKISTVSFSLLFFERRKLFLSGNFLRLATRKEFLFIVFWLRRSVSVLEVATTRDKTVHKMINLHDTKEISPRIRRDRRSLHVL